MLKAQCRLIFIVLITNIVFSQEQKQKYLYVGHAYGSPISKNKKIDQTLDDFLVNQSNNFDKVILGGDFLQVCDDDEELQNFNLLFNKYQPYFVIGNHDLCPAIIEFSNETFGGVNYFELVNNHLLIFLNTSFNSKEEAIDAYKYLNDLVSSTNSKNIIIFSHQVIFSKNDFYLRTNSRKHYEESNFFYDLIYNKYYNDNYKFYFITGDIGAFNLTPYAFYDKKNNFNFFASGLGNDYHKKAIVINLLEQIDINFIDLVSSDIEIKENYSKIKVQLYQLPKLIASKIKLLLN
jgi:hypothetical protein